MWAGCFLLPSGTSWHQLALHPCELLCLACLQRLFRGKDFTNTVLYVMLAQIASMDPDLHGADPCRLDPTRDHPLLWEPSQNIFSMIKEESGYLKAQLHISLHRVSARLAWFRVGF